MNNIFKELTNFLQKLEEYNISYSLAHNRDEAIMITIVLPGERWEVEFLRDGSVEVEKFISSGEIAGKESLGDLFTVNAEPEKVVV